MPTILGAPTPYGQAVQQDDGSVLFFPTGFDTGVGAAAPPQLDQPPPAPPGQAPLDLGAPLAPPAFPAPFAAAAPAAPAPGDPPDAADIQIEPTTPPAAAAAPPAELGPPDQVSGAAPLGSDPFAAQPPAGEDTPAAPPPAAAPLDPNEPGIDPFEREARLREQQGGIIDAGAAREQQIRTERDAAMARASAAQLEDAARFQQQREAATAAHAAAALELSDYERRQAPTSWGDNTINLIALAFGGLGMAIAGKPGENPVIAILNRRSEEEAAERTRQWQQLKGREQVAGKRIDEIGKVAKSAEEYRQAQLGAIKLDYANRMEEAGAQSKDAMAKNAADIAAAETRQEAGKHFEEAGRLNAEALRQAANTASEIKRREAMTLNDKQQVGLGWYNAKTGRKNSDEQRRHNLATEAQAADVLVARIEAANAKGESNAQIRRLEQEWAKSVRERGGPQIAYTVALKNPDGTTRYEPRYRELMNAPAVITDSTGRAVLGPDGKPQVTAQPWLAPSEPVADRLNKKYAAAAEVIDLANQMIALRARTGWESDTYKSADWRAQQQAWSQLATKYKGPEFAQLGVIAGPDLDLIAKAIGTGDPTEVRDPTAGLQAFVNNTTMALNNAMRAEGRYTGEAISFPAASTSSAPTGVDAVTKDASSYSVGARGGMDAIGYGIEQQQGTAPLMPPQLDANIDRLIMIAEAPAATPDDKLAALDGLRQVANLPAYKKWRTAIAGKYADAGLDFSEGRDPSIVGHQVVDRELQDQIIQLRTARDQLKIPIVDKPHTLTGAALAASRAGR